MVLEDVEVADLHNRRAGWTAQNQNLPLRTSEDRGSPPWRRSSAYASPKHRSFSGLQSIALVKKEGGLELRQDALASAVGGSQAAAGGAPTLRRSVPASPRMSTAASRGRKDAPVTPRDSVGARPKVLRTRRSTDHLPSPTGDENRPSCGVLVGRDQSERGEGIKFPYGHAHLQLHADPPSHKVGALRGLNDSLMSRMAMLQKEMEESIVLLEAEMQNKDAMLDSVRAELSRTRSAFEQTVSHLASERDAERLSRKQLEVESADLKQRLELFQAMIRRLEEEVASGAKQAVLWARQREQLEQSIESLHEEREAQKISFAETSQKQSGQIAALVHCNRGLIEKLRSAEQDAKTVLQLKKQMQADHVHYKTKAQQLLRMMYELGQAERAHRIRAEEDAQLARQEVSNLNAQCMWFERELRVHKGELHQCIAEQAAQSHEIVTLKADLNSAHEENARVEKVQVALDEESKKWRLKTEELDAQCTSLQTNLEGEEHSYGLQQKAFMRQIMRSERMKAELQKEHAEGMVSAERKRTELEEDLRCTIERLENELRSQSALDGSSAPLHKMQPASDHATAYGSSIVEDSATRRMVLAMLQQMNRIPTELATFGRSLTLEHDRLKADLCKVQEQHGRAQQLLQAHLSRGSDAEDAQVKKCNVVLRALDQKEAHLKQQLATFWVAYTAQISEHADKLVQECATSAGYLVEARESAKRLSELIAMSRGVKAASPAKRATAGAFSHVLREMEHGEYANGERDLSDRQSSKRLATQMRQSMQCMRAGIGSVHLQLEHSHVNVQRQRVELLQRLCEADERQTELETGRLELEAQIQVQERQLKASQLRCDDLFAQLRSLEQENRNLECKLQIQEGQTENSTAAVMNPSVGYVDEQLALRLNESLRDLQRLSDRVHETGPASLEEHPSSVLRSSTWSSNRRASDNRVVFDLQKNTSREFRAESDVKQDQTQAVGALLVPFDSDDEEDVHVYEQLLRSRHQSMDAVPGARTQRYQNAYTNTTKKGQFKLADLLRLLRRLLKPERPAGSGCAEGRREGINLSFYV
ncbi:hypothetical protein FVE85_6303 [Porphyridium purpureum]|uniref:Uncharacterized protein n=1 Tax=Porphyridium purpureum TaxID=35688 RepID=A0A5J4Z664_PORPP|nr:hypothetical protein FVE85_6303 [Porphyridium purpureum]|eukprot:POR8629..scf295_1